MTEATECEVVIGFVRGDPETSRVIGGEEALKAVILTGAPVPARIVWRPFDTMEDLERAAGARSASGDSAGAMPAGREGARATAIPDAGRARGRRPHRLRRPRDRREPRAPRS